MTRRLLIFGALMVLYGIALAMQPKGIDPLWLMLHDVTWYGFGAWFWAMTTATSTGNAVK